MTNHVFIIRSRPFFHHYIHVFQALYDLYRYLAVAWRTRRTNSLLVMLINGKTYLLSNLLEDVYILLERAGTFKTGHSRGNGTAAKVELTMIAVKPSFECWVEASTYTPSDPGQARTPPVAVLYGWSGHN
ncbi:MAG: hypothetical protein CM1200mP22_28010 [Dehalococcoidia bacterium]|nr:MAG: hypothetical protein CM1200mP22_28010 [Dehalococcoidia bacterium]